MSALRPIFNTVSIIPGMDTAAPDRTETSSGRRDAPNSRPAADCSRVIPAASVCRSTGWFAVWVRWHHAVGKTKAGGIGRPTCAMRNKPQALLPTSCAPPLGNGDPGKIV